MTVKKFLRGLWVVITTLIAFIAVTIIGVILIVVNILRNTFAPHEWRGDV